MLTQPYLLHALSPLHAGTGHAADVIDLPIARMRSTGIPILPGSSIKGVLRDACAGAAGSNAGAGRLQAVFGPESVDASAHAGALTVGDARLLALPVRSFRGTFAWVTSPLLLQLAERDLGGSAGRPTAIPQPPHPAARVGDLANSMNLPRPPAPSQLFLEDLDLAVAADPAAAAWGGFLAGHAWPAHPEAFARRFAVVDDETMSFLWETATQVDTRVRINPETRTVAEGALWVEESLPPETLLIGLLVADRSRKSDQEMTPQEVMAVALERERVLQFGGKATVGRGRCRLVPVTVTA